MTMITSVEEQALNMSKLQVSVRDADDDKSEATEVTSNTAEREEAGDRETPTSSLTKPHHQPEPPRKRMPPSADKRRMAPASVTRHRSEDCTLH